MAFIDANNGSRFEISFHSSFQQRTPHKVAGALAANKA
jgi:hypothetical protein